MVYLGLLIPQWQKWLWLELRLLILLESVTLAHNSPGGMVLRRRGAVNRRKSHIYHEVLLGCSNMKNCCSGWLRLKNPFIYNLWDDYLFKAKVVRANLQKRPLGGRPTEHSVCPPLLGYLSAGHYLNVHVWQPKSLLDISVLSLLLVVYEHVNFTTNC